VFRIRHGLARGMRRRLGFGFRPRLRLTPEEQLLAALPLRGATVYDVGAYVGMFTLFFARAVGPSGRVVSFEPHPGSRAELLANVALNELPNVMILPWALSDRTGSAALACTSSYAARSHLVWNPQDGSGIPVAVERLDELSEREALPPPDWIKIDVEGEEVRVVRGMRRTLARHRPALLVEIHARAAPLLVEELESLGYGVWHVEQRRPVDVAEAAGLLRGHLLAQPHLSQGVRTG
jgi:FkbM family methyltransferase